MSAAGGLVQIAPGADAGCCYSGHRLYGAVAYLEADESVVRHAERRGLFVIRATGSSASIVNQPGFEPRLFGRAAAT